MYDTLTRVQAGCSARPEVVDFTPAKFSRQGFDTSAYLMPDYETVSFPSRDPEIHISAFYISVSEPDAPAVVIVHGIQDCKRMPAALLPAGMLYRAGFNTLVIDLRNMGDSTVDTAHIGGVV